MSKSCDKCGEGFKGFGSVCGTCRKGKAAKNVHQCSSCQQFFSGFSSQCPDCARVKQNACAFCHKTVYAMERCGVEGLTFHAECFKCTCCGTKLNMDNFSKASDGKFYCKTHYMQLFRLRGRYSCWGEDDFAAILDSEAQRESASRSDSKGLRAIGKLDLKHRTLKTLDESKSEVEDAEEHSDSEESTADSEEFRTIGKLDLKGDHKYPRVTGDSAEADAGHSTLKPLDEGKPEAADAEKHSDSGESTAASEEFRTIGERDPAAEDHDSRMTGEPAEADARQSTLKPLGEGKPEAEAAEKHQDSGESTADSDESRTIGEIDPAGEDHAYPRMTGEPAEAGTMESQLVGEPAADIEEPQEKMKTVADTEEPRESGKAADSEESHKLGETKAAEAPETTGKLAAVDTKDSQVKAVVAVDTEEPQPIEEPAAVDTKVVQMNGEPKVVDIEPRENMQAGAADVEQPQKVGEPELADTQQSQDKTVDASVEENEQTVEGKRRSTRATLWSDFFETELLQFLEEMDS